MMCCERRMAYPTAMPLRCPTNDADGMSSCSTSSRRSGYTAAGTETRPNRERGRPLDDAE